MRKKRTKSSASIKMVEVTIYGIWSKSDMTIVFVSLKLEDVELEYDMEGYDETTHLIVSMPAYYNVNSLE